MDIAERIKAIRGAERQADFAGRLGWQVNKLGRIERGEQPPDYSDLQEILRIHAEINPAWLLTGKGPMGLDGNQALSEPPHRYADAVDLDKEYVLVPRYNVKVSAGGGAIVESEQIVDFLAFKSEWIRTSMHLVPTDLLLISTMGDSMYPTIKEGDLLLVDKSQQTVRDDAIYVLRLNDALVAKRLQKLYDGSIQIKSDNKIYDAQLVPSNKVDMLNIIGRVVWVGGRV
jgi:phage repressor protein C with HTH and peptisase S24 domain